MKLSKKINKIYKNKEGLYKTKIMDVEGDLIDCSFNNDECVTIDCSKLSYIVLTMDNLDFLWDAIEKTQRKYNKQLNK